MLTLPLHEYQEPAVDRFLERGSLLIAYEMGLGKTPIAIACAEELLGCDDVSTVLLVVPAQLRHQWAQALAKFTDMQQTTLRVKGTSITVPRHEDCVIVPSGPADKRRKALRLARETAADYVIVSYETVLSDIRLIKKLRAGMVVLDEATAIKGLQSKRTLFIKRSLDAEYRLALTGTPIENRADEIFSIMEWVDEDVLGPSDLYEQTFIERDDNGVVLRIKNAKLLHRKLSEAMIRKARADADVAPYLPEVDYDQWYVELEKDTWEDYSAIADDLLAELGKVRGGGFDLSALYKGEPNESSPPGRVMARHMAAEMLLDHPLVLMNSGSIYAITRGEKGSQYAHDFLGRHEVSASIPKMDFLMDKLNDILSFPENKVLVFSRHPLMLAIIQAHLNTDFEVDSVLYTGQLSSAAKTAAIARFRDDPKCRVFLSSHAGAYGTDMNMANYLINYDLPWSAGLADQINGRHQRASSEFDKIIVRDIICSGTIEERKFQMVEKKRELSAGLVDGKVPRDGRLENNLISLTDWLVEHE